MQEFGPTPARSFADRIWARRLASSALALLCVMVAGTIGYLVLGLSMVDSLYQTVITVSTVGYRELGEVSTGYKIFTMVLVVVGSGTVLVTVGVLLETLIEDRLSYAFGRRRMQRDINRLENHTVVCGWGQVGQAIAQTLVDDGEGVVIVDRTIQGKDLEIPYVHGDATDDDTLLSAGLDRARSLVVALDQDADAVYVTLSGRSLNPNLFIVCRATTVSAEGKLFKAGADRVVNPHRIGGARMASMVTSPHVADFLGVAMHDKELDVRLAEVPIVAGSPFENRPLSEGTYGGTIVLAVRTADGNFVHHPELSSIPRLGDILIALGTNEELDTLRQLVAPPATS